MFVIAAERDSSARYPSTRRARLLPFSFAPFTSNLPAPMSSITVPEKFTGYGAVDEAAGKAFNLTKIEFTPKNFTEDDVDIAISHCGICGSDVHVVTNGWPSPTSYHCIVGHEVSSLHRIVYAQVHGPPQLTASRFVNRSSEQSLALARTPPTKLARELELEHKLDLVANASCARTSASSTAKRA